MTRTHALLLLLCCAGPLWAQDPTPTPPKDEVAPLKEKLSAVLQVSPVVDKDKGVTLYYALQERKEAADFSGKGFDKCEIGQCQVMGRDPVTGLELGAGSRGLASTFHRLTWTGDFELTLSVQVLASPQSGVFCLLLGKQVGVLWGQRLVKARGFKPLTKTGKLDRDAFKEGRLVQLVVTRTGTKLSVKCDGLPTDELEFTKGELDGIQFGFAASNVRLVVTNLSIRGTVVEDKIR